MKKQLTYLSIFLLSGGLVLAACGHADKPTGGVSSPTSSSAAATEEPLANPPAHFIKFIKHPVMDTQGTKMVASTYLLPDDWKVQEQLWWDFNDPSVPVRYRAQLNSPDGSLGYEVFPTVRVAYSVSGGKAIQGLPPPESVTQGIEQYLANQRSQLRYQVTGRQDSPPQVVQSQQSYGMQSQTQRQSGLLRISYQANGQVVEEELMATLEQTRTESGAETYSMLSVIWQLDVSLVRASKGKLDLARRIGGVVRGSSRPELPWFNQVLSIANMLRDGVMRDRLRQQQDFNAAMQNQREINAMHQAAYEEQIRVSEKQNEQFGDLMGGVERYVDPYQHREVQIPVGYDNVWVSSKGEYLMSETSGFNPNQYTQLATEGWKKIEKKSP